MFVKWFLKEYNGSMKFETSKKFSKVSGIYVIRKYSTIVYVGSTLNFEKRFLEHRKQLRKQVHANTHLQRSYEMYGPDNFYFEPIEVLMVLDKDILLTREQWHLDRHDNLYNICKVAGSSLGMKHSDKFKQQISERRLGKAFEDSSSSIRSDNSSGFVGVSFSKSKQLWRARCSLFGKEYFLGYFDTPEKAYNARLEFLASDRSKPSPITRRDNTSGYPGISWYEKRGQWRAFCYIDKKFKHLGFFNTKEEALSKRLEFKNLHGNDNSPIESD